MAPSRSSLKKLFPFALGLVTLTLGWTLASVFFTPAVVPGLHTVLGKILEHLSQGDWGVDLALTFLRTLAGFSLAFILGIPWGIFMGRSRGGDGLFFLPVILLQAAPPLLWVVPLILVLGTDGQAPLAVVFLVVFPLVVLNIRDSRRALSPAQVDVFRIYAPSRRLKRRELLFPAMAPALRSSLVLGLVLGLKSAIIGEWFGSHTGIGRTINQYYFTFDMENFYALALIFLTLAAFLGFGGERLAQALFPPRKPLAKAPPVSRSLADRPRPAPGQVALVGVDFAWGHRKIFHQVNLNIAPGTILALSGPSGTGKTTLARLALGLLKPQKGEVRLPQRPAVLFQDDGLLAHRDALGNVLLPAWEQKIPDPEPRAWELLGLVGLAGEESKFPDELSGGMRKRLALARALMQNPDFMVLDEPFQNLDAPSRLELWDLTFSVIRDWGLGALIITHYPQELEGRGVLFSRLDEGGVLA